MGFGQQNFPFLKSAMNFIPLFFFFQIILYSVIIVVKSAEFAPVGT